MFGWLRAWRRRRKEVQVQRQYCRVMNKAAEQLDKLVFNDVLNLPQVVRALQRRELEEQIKREIEADNERIKQEQKPRDPLAHACADEIWPKPSVNAAYRGVQVMDGATPITDGTRLGPIPLGTDWTVIPWKTGEFDEWARKSLPLGSTNASTIDYIPPGTSKVREMLYKQVVASYPHHWRQEAYAAGGIPTVREVFMLEVDRLLAEEFKQYEPLKAQYPDVTIDPGFVKCESPGLADPCGPPTISPTAEACGPTVSQHVSRCCGFQPRPGKSPDSAFDAILEEIRKQTTIESRPFDELPPTEAVAEPCAPGDVSLPTNLEAAETPDVVTPEDTQTPDAG